MTRCGTTFASDCQTPGCSPVFPASSKSTARPCLTFNLLFWADRLECREIHWARGSVFASAVAVPLPAAIYRRGLQSHGLPDERPCAQLPCCVVPARFCRREPVRQCGGLRRRAMAYQFESVASDQLISGRQQTPAFETGGSLSVREGYSYVLTFVPAFVGTGMRGQHRNSLRIDSR